jgi:hypothetical protein
MPFEIGNILNRSVFEGIFHIVNEYDQLMVAEAAAEKVRGDLLDPLRLITNEDFKTREDFPETTFFDHQIGKQQVVIGDDDLASGGLPAKRTEVAVFPVRTSGAMTLICRGGYCVPEEIVVTQPIEFRAVRQLGPLQPFLEALVVGPGLRL